MPRRRPTQQPMPQIAAGDRRKAMEALASEITKRREKDPLLAFRPFDIQGRFIRSVLYGEKIENFYLGANRCGKSDAGAYIGATLARFGYPDDSPYAAHFVGAAGSSVSVRDRATCGWVSALDYPVSRDTIQPKYFDNGFGSGMSHAPFIPQYEILDWRPADQLLILKNGSIIGFKSADSGRAKYQGAEKDWVHLDEEHPQDIYGEISIRVGSRPLNIFTTATLLPPMGTVGGVTWLFPEVIRPWKSGARTDIGIFNASIYDNPHILASELDRLQARFPPESVQGRIRLGGELIPGASGARIYSSFDSQLNVSTKSWEVSSRRPLIWTMDFNVEPMVSLVCQQDGRNYRVLDEIVLEEGSIPEMVDEFRKRYPSHMAEILIYGDASGHDRSHQTRKSSYAMILNCMMSYPAPLRMRVPNVNPGVDTRIQAVNRACRDENGERRLIVDARCEELIADLEGVVSDGRAGIKKVSNRKDPYHRRTHTSDALGYWLTYEAPVIALPRHSASDSSIPRRRYNW